LICKISWGKIRACYHLLVLQGCRPLTSTAGLLSRHWIIIFHNY
jgi:hypothetical protein